MFRVMPQDFSGRGLLLYNRLSKKPAQAIPSLERLVKNEFSGYKFLISQNYSTDRVSLQLLGRYMGVSGQRIAGYVVNQTREVPITQNSKFYKRAIRELVKAQKEAALNAEI